MVVQALCCADELDDAERISDSALAAARRRGSLLNFAMASYHRAIARYHRGELTDALADLDQALIASREGWTAGDPWTGGLRVHIHVERGDLAAARDALAMTTGASPGSMDLPIALFARAPSPGGKGCSPRLAPGPGRVSHHRGDTDGLTAEPLLR
jgi:predicted Zn-dependent protease